MIEQLNQYPYNNTVADLLKVGAHLGGFISKWNPKMRPYIYGQDNGYCVIDLGETQRALERACKKIEEISQKGGRILFVCTNKRLHDMVAALVSSCGHFYVNYRWLGGTLTNWATVSKSIRSLVHYETLLQNAGIAKTEIANKKELLKIERRAGKLRNLFGGIKNMGSIPDFVVLVNGQSHQNAFHECKKLGVPVCAVVDSNGVPGIATDVDHFIPGNNVSDKAAEFYLYTLCRAAERGMLLRGKHDDGVGAGASHEDRRHGMRGSRDNKRKFRRDS